MLIPLVRRAAARSPTAAPAWRIATASAAVVNLRQDPAMTGPKRDRWTEAEVIALPAGEHDYFDRKSGGILTDPDFRRDMAKVLCALANSGGGHVVIGVEDDGTLSGVPALRGRTSTREWLEQVIPNLVSFPLEDFRVHQVEPATPSLIPADRVVLVVDVGDSVLAPHQTEGTRTYYYREGGHSKPAPHFYLETLRNRLTRPTLGVSLRDLRRSNAYPWRDGVFVETRLGFVVTNTGRVAAYKWAVIVEGTDGDAPGRESDYLFSFSQFPGSARGRSSSISLDDTILPGLRRYFEADFGFLLRSPAHDHDGILRELKTVVSPDLVLRYRIVTETSPGETIRTPLASIIEYDKFFETIFPLSSTP
jgi:hypothetical protein